MADPKLQLEITHELLLDTKVHNEKEITELKEKICSGLKDEDDVINKEINRLK